MKTKIQLNDAMFRKFRDNINIQMPLLMAANRIPINTKQLMKIRLEIDNSQNPELNDFLKLSDSLDLMSFDLIQPLKLIGYSELIDSLDLIDFFNDNSIITGDSIACSRNGKIKPVIYDSQILRNLNPQSKLSDGALVLSDEVYDSIDAPEFTREYLEKYEFYLTEKQVLDNPIWNLLSREDKVLLRDYTKMVFRKIKTKYDYNEGMAICLGDSQDQPIMRLWTVDLDDGSSVDGLGYLNNSYGHLISVPKKLQSVGNLNARVSGLELKII